jgi:acetyl esterase/lipase
MNYVRIAACILAISFATKTHAVERRVYKKTDVARLNLGVRYPEGHKKSDRRPAIIFFHGGGWVSGKPNQFNAQARAFAKLDYVTITVGYRLINKHGTTVYECVKDAKSAVRWVRMHAAEMGVNPKKIVAGGGSAGGHLAACTAMVKGFNEQGEDKSVSCVPNALLLLSPVLDTTKKGYGSKRMTRGKKTDLSPCHLVRKGFPPTIVFYGTQDKTVPPENAERFGKLMKEAENNCVLVPFEGRGHRFFNHPALLKRNKIEDFNAVIEKGKAFLDLNGLKP